MAWAQGDLRRALVLATEASMWAGIEALQVGERLNDVGEGVQDLLEEFNAPERLAGLPPEMPSFEIVDGYTGHGVGRELHQDPTVYNEYVNERLPKVKTGLVVAVEPMVTLGTYETHELDDGWTVKTDDGSLAAHFEHTVAVTEKGLWVLTAQDGAKAFEIFRQTFKKNLNRFDGQSIGFRQRVTRRDRKAARQFAERLARRNRRRNSFR